MIFSEDLASHLHLVGWHSGQSMLLQEVTAGDAMTVVQGYAPLISACDPGQHGQGLYQHIDGYSPLSWQ